MGGGGFTASIGAIHQHAGEVADLGVDFGRTSDTLHQELWVSATTFGVMWAPVCLPPFAAGAQAITGLDSTVGTQLQNLGKDIKQSADRYDHVEAANHHLILKTMPDGDTLGSVFTNDISHGHDDLPDGGIVGDLFGTVQSFSSLSKDQGFGDQFKGGVQALQSSLHVMFDLVGFIDDPVNNFAGDLVGTLIDYVWPLKELLDATLGDPDAIQTVSQTWDSLARHMVDCGVYYQDSLSGIAPPAWEGPASDAYRKRAEEAIGLLGSLGESCESFSEVMLVVGGIIGDTRQFLIDSVCGFIVEQLAAFGIAVATSEITFGASLVAFWAEFEIALEFEEVECVLAVAQAIMDLIANTAVVTTQAIQFEQYKGQLDT